jgi:hypothetical protein
LTLDEPINGLGPSGIIEIGNFFEENKEYDIGKYFDEKIIILINVSDDILTKHINDRKSRNVTGDYLKVDVFAMKRNIEKRFNEMPSDFIKYVANITIDNDYEHEYEKIMVFLSTYLHT